MTPNITERLLTYRLNVFHDKDAFARLYELHANAIFRFVFLKVPTRETAEDLAADVFVNLWGYVSAGKKIEHFRGLAYKMARAAVAGYYRRTGREPVISVAMIDDAVLTEEVELGDRHIRLQDLVSALCAVREESADLLALRYLEELSIKEIAVILDRTPDAVKVALYRARGELRGALDQGLSTTKKG